MGTAQNKLGELFVDIGIGGLGKTLKGLNSVSASFLLAKNAAKETLQPLTSMAKTFNNSVQHMDKFAAVTGITWKQQEKLSRYLRNNRTNISSFESAITSFQRKIAQGELGAPLEQGFLLAGINIRDYADKSIFELFDAVDVAYKKILKNRGKEQASNFLAMVGLDPYEFAYLFQHKSAPLWQDVDNKIDDSVILTERLHQNIEDNIDATNRLSNAWDSFSKKLYGNTAPLLTGVENLASDVLEGNNIGGAIGAGTGLIGGSIIGGKLGKNVTKNMIKKQVGKKVLGKIGSKLAGRAIGSAIGATGGPVGLAIGLGVGAAIDYAIGKAIDKSNVNGLENISGIPTDTIGNYSLTQPPNIDNRQINVTQNINTSDPVMAGNTAVQKMQQFEILDIDTRYEPIQY